MGLHRLSINGKEAIFYNSWRGTASGFVHETELYIDGWRAAAARCYYINRTWERYCYQSVMLQAVHKLQEEETARERAYFLQANGYKNMMEHRKPAFMEYLASNENLALYNKIEEALR